MPSHHLTVSGCQAILWMTVGGCQVILWMAVGGCQVILWMMVGGCQVILMVGEWRCLVGAGGIGGELRGIVLGQRIADGGLNARNS